MLIPGRGTSAEAKGAGGAGEEGGEKNGGWRGSEEDPLSGGADRHPQQEALYSETGVWPAVFVFMHKSFLFEPLTLFVLPLQEEDALLSEMDVTGQAFEDMQEQNIRLMQQLREKDDANFKLMSERIKSNQIHKLLKEEKEELADQLLTLKTQVSPQGTLFGTICKKWFSTCWICVMHSVKMLASGSCCYIIWMHLRLHL